MSSDRHKILAAVLGVPAGHTRQPFMRPLNVGLPQVRQIPTSWRSSPSGSFLLSLVLGFALVTGVFAGLLTEMKFPNRVQIVLGKSDKDDELKPPPNSSVKETPKQENDTKPDRKAVGTETLASHFRGH